MTSARAKTNLLAAAFAMMLAVQCSAAALIGEAAAVGAALKHANLSEEDITIVSFALTNAGEPAYEIAFDSANMSYRYTIGAESAEVLKFSADSRRDGGQKPRRHQPEGTIGPDRARDIALGHAKVQASRVRKLEIELEHKYGRAAYDVEFDHGGWEYEYKIDATTGEIISWHREWD